LIRVDESVEYVILGFESDKVNSHLVPTVFGTRACSFELKIFFNVVFEETRLGGIGAKVTSKSLRSLPIQESELCQSMYITPFAPEVQSEVIDVKVE